MSDGSCAWRCFPPPGFPIPMPDRQLSEDQGSHSSTNWGSDGDEEETVSRTYHFEEALDADAASFIIV